MYIMRTVKLSCLFLCYRNAALTKAIQSYVILAMCATWSLALSHLHIHTHTCIVYNTVKIHGSFGNVRSSTSMREKKLHGERINYAKFEYYYMFFCGRFAVVCYLCYSLITIISICNFANVILIQERNSINFFCCPPIFRGRERGKTALKLLPVNFTTK